MTGANVPLPFPNWLDTCLSSLVYLALLSQTVLPQPTCLHPVGFPCHDVCLPVAFDLLYCFRYCKYAVQGFVCWQVPMKGHEI